ncbi:hypothetical protein TWF281_011580 [Arthrobotrys megalospora]
MLKTIRLFGVLLLIIGYTEAFIPDDLKALFGLHGSSHMDQTRKAMKQLWTTWYGGIPGWLPTNKMGLAVDEIAEANALVDDDQKNGELHFDGESFRPAQERLINLANQAISFSNAGDYIAARKSVGMALHTLQDFYAHSNWLESLIKKGAPHRIYPGLGRPDTMIYPLGRTTDTCKPCTKPSWFRCDDCSSNIDTVDLTSGYYAGEPAFVKPSNEKCSHGGPFDDSSVSGQGINKDTPSCWFAPHNDLHYDAARLGVAATIEWVDSQIYKRLPQLQADLLFGKAYKNGSLMNPSSPSKWDFVKTSIEPHKRGLVTRAATVDHNMHLLVAVDNVHEHGKALVRAAVGGGRKVYPVQLVQRDINGAERQCDDYGWWNIALATGGHLITFPENETAEAAALLDMLSQPNHIEVLSVAGAGSAERTVSEFSFPLDSSLGSLVISTSGVSSFDLFSPNGSSYRLDTLSNGIQRKRVGNSIALNFSATAVPPPGLYRISVKTATNYTISISGESELSIRSFNFVQERGRPQHQALFSIPSSPIAGQKAMVKAHVHGNFTEGKFEFRTKAGALIASQDKIKRDSTHENMATSFYGDSSKVPEDDFMVYFTGINEEGDRFQRAIPLMMSSSSLQLTAPIIQRMTVGEPRTVTIELTNLNRVADTYDVFAVDSKDSLVKITNSSLYLEAGASESFDAHFLPQQNSTTGMTEIVFGAKGRATKGNISLQRFVLEPEPKDISYWNIKYHQYANETGQLIDRLMMGKER